MNSNDIFKRWLSVAEAADYLGCSRNFLDRDRITKLHGIRFSRLGRHVRYDRVDLDAFLEACKERPVTGTTRPPLERQPSQLL